MVVQFFEKHGPDGYGNVIYFLTFYYFLCIRLIITPYLIFFCIDKQKEHFYGSEKAIKRYRNMNKSGDVVTTVSVYCFIIIV